jgi:hypothetical protein
VGLTLLDADGAEQVAPRYSLECFASGFRFPGFSRASRFRSSVLDPVSTCRIALSNRSNSVLRWNGRTDTVESALSLDILDLKRKGSWIWSRAFPRKSSGLAMVSTPAVPDICCRSVTAYPLRCVSDMRPSTEIREAMTIGSQSLPHLATTAESDFGSSALAGKLTSSASAAAGSCLHPRDQFSLADSAKSLPTRARKNLAVSSMN